MRSEHAVGQELSKLGLWPAMDDGVNDAMEIRARVDLVSDARRDDREDVAGAGTRLNTGTRGRCAGGAPRPGWLRRRFFLSSSEVVSSVGFAALGTMRPSMGSTSCCSSRRRTSERGRLRRRCASCATSSVLMSRMRAMRARTAVTRSTKRSAATIFWSHARTSSRSGAKAEVTFSREAIVMGFNRRAIGKFPGALFFLRG
jgi:hypothetical protein